MVNWKKYSLSFLFLILANLTFGQGWITPQEDLIFWVSPGKQSIDINFKIREGIHINSNRPESDLMIPTEMAAEWPEGVVAGEVIFSKTQSFQLQGVSGTFQVFAEDFTIKIPLEIKDPLDTVHVPLKITYQPCDHRKCYFPRVEELEIVLVGQ